MNRKCTPKRDFSTAALGFLLAAITATGLHAQQTNDAPSGVMDVAISGSTPSGVGVHGESSSATGVGVLGEAVSASGTTYGVYGWSDSPSGYGVYGEGAGYGVQGVGYYGVTGKTSASSGTGVIGEATATSGPARGVLGVTQSPSGRGVYGWSLATSGTSYGVYGRSVSTIGVGVFGEATSSSGFNYGVRGESSSSSGVGVYGVSAGHGVRGEGAYGVTGYTSLPSGSGVFGESTATTGATAYGVYGISHSPSGRGVAGYAAASSGLASGVFGSSGSSTGRGVFGFALGQSAYALYGRATGEYGKGLYTEITSTHSSANAILAISGGGSSYAAYLVGRVHITGALRVIDVPVGDFANMQYNTATGQLFYDNSSRRNKENIEPFNANFGAILSARPVQYTRPDAPDRLEIGYIAEDMEALGLDSLIGYNADGQVETFNYEKMILYVVEVLKEQQRTIDHLQSEVERLRPSP